MPADEKEEENSRPAWAVPLGILLIAGIAGGIGFYVYKKRKKKDDGDDEDLMI